MVSASIDKLLRPAGPPAAATPRTDSPAHDPSGSGPEAFSTTLQRKLGREEPAAEAPASGAERPERAAGAEARAEEAAARSGNAGEPARAPRPARDGDTGPQTAEPLDSAASQALPAGDASLAEAAPLPAAEAAPAANPPVPPEMPAAGTASAFSAETAASIAALIAGLASRPTIPAGTGIPGAAAAGAAVVPRGSASQVAQDAASPPPLMEFDLIGRGRADAPPTADARPELQAPDGRPAASVTADARDAATHGRDLRFAALAEPRSAGAAAPSSAPAAAVPPPALATAAGSAAETVAMPASAMPGDAASALAGAAASHPLAVRSEAPVAQLPVHTPAGQRAWAEDVGNRVVWMLGRNDAKAELILTPAHLGKLEISIQLNGDQTTAHFVAATSAARDALEQALPRLRETLQQAGINLGEANVSTSAEQQARQGHAFGRPGPRGSGATEAGTPDGFVAAPVSTWIQSGRGVVDTFA